MLCALNGLLGDGRRLILDRKSKRYCCRSNGVDVSTLFYLNGFISVTCRTEMSLTECSIAVLCAVCSPAGVFSPSCGISWRRSR